MTTGQRFSWIVLALFGAYMAIAGVVYVFTDDDDYDRTSPNDRTSLHQNAPEDYLTCDRMIARQHLDHPPGWARCNDMGEIIDLQDDPRFQG